jgi:hypothetical protein
MGRLLLVGVFSMLACAAGLAESGTFFTMAPSLSGIDAAAPRYTREDERLVSEIAGSILNIAAFADHFEPGDPFQVRNVSSTRGVAKFSLTRRAELFTVEVRRDVWRPEAFLRLARSFMADGAGVSISEDPTVDHAAALATPSGEEAVAAENQRLSRLLQAHPRSPALHEKAALLLALVATERATAEADIRPLLCRMTAHLAVARALHGNTLSGDGQLAERLLAQLSDREAAVARPRTAASVPPGPAIFAETPRFVIVPVSAGSE